MCLPVSSSLYCIPNKVSQFVLSSINFPLILLYLSLGFYLKYVILPSHQLKHFRETFFTYTEIKYSHGDFTVHCFMTAQDRCFMNAVIWVQYIEWLPKILCCNRYCGSGLPPDLTSSGTVMTVVFVADEGVADSGFYASYQAIPLSESKSHHQWSSCQYRLFVNDGH